MRLGIVVNQPGLQHRRASEIASRLNGPDCEVDVVVAPTSSAALRSCRGWDAAYVIDPGRRGMPAAAIARALGKPTVVEIGDPQGELYRAQGRSRAAIRAGQLIDTLVVRHASGVVFRGADLATTFKPKVPWTWIPDGVDLSAFIPGSGIATRARLHIPADDLVVGMVGSIVWSETRQSAYGLDAVEALGYLSDLPVRALIVGDGDGLARLVDRARTLGVEKRVTFTGRVPHEEIPRLLSAMDVCISTQSNDAIGRGRTTAKLPEYLACDRYVLATPVGTAAKILPPEMLIDHGESGDAEHQRRLAHRLEDLFPRRAEVRSGAGTRPLAERHFGYDAVAASCLAFVQRVMGR